MTAWNALQGATLPWHRIPPQAGTQQGISRSEESMARQSRAQKKTIERVMHEYKHGELKRGRGGGKVKTPKQAIAIALSEAGASRKQSPKENRRRLRRTKEREGKGETAQARREGRQGRTAGRPASHYPRSRQAKARSSRPAGSQRSHGKTKGELYAEARRRDIPGRSRMSKQQLAKAVGSR
jgi:hypothetical protein